MNIYTKQKQTHKHTKQTWLSKGKDGQAGINQEHGINRYILHKVDKQQGFTVISIGRYIQHLTIINNRKKSKNYILIKYS